MPLVGSPDEIYEGRLDDGLRSFIVRPAIRRDPNPDKIGYAPAAVALWCAAFPLGAIILMLVALRLGELVFDLFHPVH